MAETIVTMTLSDDETAVVERARLAAVQPVANAATWTIARAREAIAAARLHQQDTDEVELREKFAQADPDTRAAVRRALNKT